MSLFSLKIQTPGRDPFIHKVQGKSVSVGRAPANVVSVPEDAGLSNAHLRIDVTDQGLVAQDLKSSNGTFVNKKNIGHLPYRLRPNDAIQAGHTVITVLAEKKKSRRGLRGALSGITKGITGAARNLLKGVKTKPRLPQGYAQCPDCGARIHVGSRPAGARVGCPKCKNSFILE